MSTAPGAGVCGDFFFVHREQSNGLISNAAQRIKSLMLREMKPILTSVKLSLMKAA